VVQRVALPSVAFTFESSLTHIFPECCSCTKYLSTDPNAPPEEGEDGMTASEQLNNKVRPLSRAKMQGSPVI
jgi:hypothetical protein